MVNTEDGLGQQKHQIKASTQPQLQDLCVFVAVDLKQALNSMPSRVLKCVRV